MKMTPSPHSPPLLGESPEANLKGGEYREVPRPLGERVGVRGILR